MVRRKLLLIDGYNVIHRIPELKCGFNSGGLENARLNLALLISGWNRSRPGTECIIVFDGDIQFSVGREQRLSGIRSVFTRASHGGDSEIIRFVSGWSGNKSDITVISDDNSVRNNCRAHGATVKSSSFILTSKTRPSPSKSKASADGKGLDRKAAADIDEELRKKFGL